MARRRKKKNSKVKVFCSVVAIVLVAILAGMYLGYKPFTDFVDTKLLVHFTSSEHDHNDDNNPTTQPATPPATTGEPKDAGFGPLNGDITVTSKTTAVSVSCSNNNIVLKDSAWFKEQVALGYRTVPTDWVNASVPTTPEILQNVDDEISFHFLQLGNNYTGDSTYIKVKGDNNEDIDILIDAGSRQNSAPTIEAYVDKYCTDRTLEYVIATHAHQDHIAGFVSTTKTEGILEYYECENIIQFARTNADTRIYEKYQEAVSAEQTAGANVYTALECYNNENGAQRVYNLTDNITMQILYNYYYDHDTNDENDYSVCVLFTHGARQFLFTGDLEAEGESYLVDNNKSILGQVELFKGGHHGSYTASTDKLLDEIQPKIVCVCCCAGSVEYTDNMQNTFPSQAFINRVSKHTVQVYVTTLGIVNTETTQTSSYKANKEYYYPNNNNIKDVNVA